MQTKNINIENPKSEIEKIKFVKMSTKKKGFIGQATMQPPQFLYYNRSDEM